MAHPYAKNMDDKAGAARAKQFVKGYAKGGAVTVNIVTAPKEEKPPLPPIIPPPPGPPMAGPPPGPPMPPPGPGGPMPGMKSGGRVNMKGGAESGEGRLDKKRAYGKSAKRG